MAVCHTILKNPATVGGVPLCQHVCLHFSTKSGHWLSIMHFDLVVHCALVLVVHSSLIPALPDMYATVVPDKADAMHSYCLAQFGLFHGDPHPGNIFALRDGRIAYVDFGNVAEVSQANKQTLIDAVVHAVNEDYDRDGQGLHQAGARARTDQRGQGCRRNRPGVLAWGFAGMAGVDRGLAQCMARTDRGRCCAGSACFLPFEHATGFLPFEHVTG